jgi:hypothetical protein
VLQSVDGITWTRVLLPGFWAGGGGAISACWSESHQLWYALGAQGELCSTPDLNTAWTRLVDLSGDSPKFYDIAAFGRNLVACGAEISGYSGATTRGSIVVLSAPEDLDAGPRYAISPHCGTYANVGTGKTEDDPWWQRFIFHDGRLVAARVRVVDTSKTVTEFAASMRAPWESAT